MTTTTTTSNLQDPIFKLYKEKFKHGFKMKTFVLFLCFASWIGKHISIVFLTLDNVAMGQKVKNHEFYWKHKYVIKTIQYKVQNDKVLHNFWATLIWKYKGWKWFFLRN
jgi:hypothetical protein